MDLSSSRDIAVVIFCIVGSAAAALLTAIAISLSRKIGPILESVRDIHLLFSQLGGFLDKLRRIAEFFREGRGDGS